MDGETFEGSMVVMLRFVVSSLEVSSALFSVGRAIATKMCIAKARINTSDAIGAINPVCRISLNFQRAILAPERLNASIVGMLVPLSHSQQLHKKE